MRRLSAEIDENVLSRTVVAKLAKSFGVTRVMNRKSWRLSLRQVRSYLPQENRQLAKRDTTLEVQQVGEELINNERVVDLVLVAGRNDDVG